MMDPGPDPDAGIAGATLSLRPARPDDALRWLETHTDPVQLAYGLPATLEPPRCVEDLDERIVASRTQWADRAPGVLVVVETRETDHFLGTLSWRFDVHPSFRIADIGYSVHPAVRGRGVATGAVGLLLRWLLHDHDGPRLARVQLDHSVENPASCRTAVKAGLEQEGVRRGFLPLRDAAAPDGVRRHDVCLHGIIRDR